jgi:CDP-6-deoxy-D-xylo-4-hexulose-3-dehydrase
MDCNEIVKKITKKTIAIFITHAQGFNGLSNQLLKIIKKKKILLIEDVCESHGSKFGKKKLGSFGIMSNFSFYYAHHMTTIEGGMISTNNKNLYEILRSLRSHGLLREMNDRKLINSYVKKYPYLSEEFIFLYPGYNLRNNEIGAVLGRSQLKDLNKNIKKRNENFLFFLKNLNKDLYRVNFDLNGISNYAFPLILKRPDFKLRNKLEKIMKKNKIEFRRGNAGGGNQLRQPYISKYIKKINMKDFKNVEHVHNFGYYIGNFPSLKKEKIVRICKILNKL